MKTLGHIGLFLASLMLHILQANAADIYARVGQPATRQAPASQPIFRTCGECGAVHLTGAS